MDKEHWIRKLRQRFAEAGMYMAPIKWRRDGRHKGLHLPDRKLEQIPLVSAGDILDTREMDDENRFHARVKLGNLLYDGVETGRVPSLSLVQGEVYQSPVHQNTLSLVFGLTFFPLENNKRDYKCVSSFGAEYRSKNHPRNGSIYCFFGEDIVLSRNLMQSERHNLEATLDDIAKNDLTVPDDVNTLLNLQRRQERGDPEEMVRSIARNVVYWYDKVV